MGEERVGGVREVGEGRVGSEIPQGGENWEKLGRTFCNRNSTEKNYLGKGTWE